MVKFEFCSNCMSIEIIVLITHCIIKKSVVGKPQFKSKIEFIRYYHCKKNVSAIIFNKAKRKNQLLPWSWSKLKYYYEYLQQYQLLATILKRYNSGRNFINIMNLRLDSWTNWIPQSLLRCLMRWSNLIVQLFGILLLIQ